MEQVEKAFDDFTAKFATAHKGAVDTALKFNALAVKAQGDFAKQQMALVETMLDAGTRQVKLVTETRDPAEFVAKNAELVVDLNDKLMSAAQANLEIQSKVRDEFASLVEDNVNQFSTGVAKPAKASTRKAA